MIIEYEPFFLSQLHCRKVHGEPGLVLNKYKLDICYRKYLLKVIGLGDCTY